MWNNEIRVRAWHHPASLPRGTTSRRVIAAASMTVFLIPFPFLLPASLPDPAARGVRQNPHGYAGRNLQVPGAPDCVPGHRSRSSAGGLALS